MPAEPMALDDRADWKRDAATAIEARAKTGAPFTANDLTRDGLREPPHPNMWGAAFLAAHRHGVIDRIGYTPSPRKTRAHGVCAVWTGTTSWTQPALFDAA